MPRLSQLDDVLFPVEEHPVFASVKTKSGERRLSVPEKKAIVDQAGGRVLGVVSRGYRLVTNRQALDWGYECCRAAFPETKTGEWEVKAIDAPGTRGHCFIDLVHNSTVLDFAFVPAKDRPDAFGPFVRVINSYNGLRALAFDIGFFRKVCKNGLIVPESVVRFKFTHMHKDIGETIRFEIAHDRLAKLKASFGEYFNVLQSFRVGRSEFEPLLVAVLLIHKPKNATPHTREGDDWDALWSHLNKLCNRYAEELGENAYAVFNAITEFASHPPENRCLHRERHSFQRRAGVWLTYFSHECHKPGFRLDEHIKKLTTNNGDSSPGATPVSTRHL